MLSWQQHIEEAEHFLGNADDKTAPLAEAYASLARVHMELARLLLQVDADQGAFM